MDTVYARAELVTVVPRSCLQEDDMNVYRISSTLYRLVFGLAERKVLACHIVH